MIIDIDECLSSDSYPCHSSAICQNRIGSYDCVCFDGYKKTVDECLCKLILLQINIKKDCFDFILAVF